MSVQDILLQNETFFRIADIVENLFRWILWQIIKVLTFMSDGLEGITDKIYTLNNFFENSKIESLINILKPAFWAILTVSILYIGYKIVINREFKGERIFQNCIISLMVIFLLPTLMSSLNNLTTSAINAINVDKQVTTARSIIKDNLYDLEYLKEKDFNIGDYKNDTKVATNSLNPSNILRIPINETVSNGGILSDTPEAFKKKLEINVNGEPSVKDLDKSFFGLIQENYYRFNFDFMIIMTSLLCLILTFILTAIKIARIIIELAFKKIFAITLAFGDVASGQKLKTVLQDILSSFAIIFVTALLLKIYIIGINWVGTINANWIIRLIFMIGLSLMVIDAPNIVERILGIDAGIKSGWGLIAGAYSGAKILGEIGNTAGKLLGNTTNALASAGGGVAGFFDGAKKTLEEQKEEVTQSSNNRNISDNKENRNSNDLATNNTSNSSLNSENAIINTNSINSNGVREYGNSKENSNDLLKEDSNILSSEYGQHRTLLDDKNSLMNNTSSDNISSNGVVEDNLNNISSDNIGSNEAIEDNNKKDNLGSSFENNLRNHDNLGTNNSDKDILKNTSKLETRTLGQYMTDKLEHNISSSRPIQSAKRSYHIGLNTGDKFVKMLNKNNKNEERM